MRREVQEFAEGMEYKLSMHDDRPGWKECDSKWLIARMKEEIAEVEKVLEERGDGWLSKLYEECTDVGNFAMMVWDAERLQWVNRKAKSDLACMGETKSKQALRENRELEAELRRDKGYPRER